MPWSTSDRRGRLPADWPQRRAAVRQRAAGRCEAAEHVPTCDGIGSECDHVDRGDDHSLANLQWLSAACHAAKTVAEARAARPSRRRAPERHPNRP